MNYFLNTKIIIFGNFGTQLAKMGCHSFWYEDNIPNEHFLVEPFKTSTEFDPYDTILP